MVATISSHISNFNLCAILLVELLKLMKSCLYSNYFCLLSIIWWGFFGPRNSPT